MLASHLRMPLRECMQKHTHREYLLWMAWLAKQHDTPDRSDYYLMQIAAEIRRVLSKQPNKIKLEHFKLSTAGKPAPVQQRETVEQSKARWAGLVGYKGKL